MLACVAPCRSTARAAPSLIGSQRSQELGISMVGDCVASAKKRTM